jgi:methyl-accepting chemotaxis protein
MLSFFKNLRVAQRLAIAFGALIVAMAAIAAVGVIGLGKVNERTERIGDENLPALQSTGAYDTYTQALVRLVADHLYVQDGDPKAQAETETLIKTVTDLRAKEVATLKEELAGTSAAAPLAALFKLQVSFDRAMNGAITNSKRETAAGSEDRTASRTFYTKVLAPAGATVNDAGNAVKTRVRALADANVADASSSATGAKRTMLIVAIVAGLAAIGLALLTIRSIMRPVRAIGERVRSLNDHCLRDLEDGMAAVAEGDLTHEAKTSTSKMEVQSKDELGELSVTFNQMLEKAHGTIHSYNRMRGQLSDTIGDLAASAGTVSAASQQLTSTSEETSRAVAEIAGAISDVAAGAESQVQQVDRVRSAMEETVITLGDSGRSAEEAAGVAAGARATAENGLQAVASADAAMRSVQSNSQATAEAISGLAERSGRIGGFVETITGIAGQTNLLALNAAIEAARAGEQGRGFAVVAEQVRKLAEESQEAATTIAGLVAEIQTEMERTVGVVQDGVRRTEEGTVTVADARSAFEAIGSAVEDMSARIAAVAAAGQEAAASSERISADIAGVSAVAETSSATAEQVSASTQETSASAQQISASAHELATTAQVLDGLVARFRTTAV